MSSRVNKVYIFQLSLARIYCCCELACNMRLLLYRHFTSVSEMLLNCYPPHDGQKTAIGTRALCNKWQWVPVRKVNVHRHKNSRLLILSRKVAWTRLARVTVKPSGHLFLCEHFTFYFHSFMFVFLTQFLSPITNLRYPCASVRENTRVWLVRFL